MTQGPYDRRRCAGKSGRHEFDDPGDETLTALLLLPAAAGLALLGGGARLGRWAFLVAGLISAAGFAWAAAVAPSVIAGRAITLRQAWVPALDLSFEFRLDAFSLLFVLLLTGIGTLVHWYAASYFGASRAGLHRLAGLLLIFTAAMLGVVTAANLLVLFVAWELTSITSYLLIGWTDQDARARAAALQALLTTGAGGLAMLGGFVLIGEAAGTYSLAALAADPPTGTVVDVALVLILLGAFTKSAQFPFSAWLPGAMVAPTPVSAFLHSATMVKAGVYLVARLAPMFASYGPWRPLVLSVGLATMLTGGWRALRQYDLKRILAYGTVSQLGFMILLFGVGTPDAALAGTLLVLAHALFKASLFLVVGVIDHQAHTRDIRQLGRYAPGWRGPMIAAVVSGASMAGIPLAFGFVAKEASYEAWAHLDVIGSRLVLAGVVAGSILTFSYTARLLLGAFRPGPATERTPPGLAEVLEETPAPQLAFWIPAAILAGITLALGVLPDLASGLVGAAAASLEPEVEHVHLAIWHGVGLPLVLTALTFALGAVLVLGGPVVARVQARWTRPVDGEAVYLGSLRLLNRVADRVTGIVQPGSLPVYIGVILTSVVLVAGAGLLQAPVPDLPPLVSGPGDWVVAALLVVGGIATVASRERISAIVCLGAVGLGMSLLFVLQGAPDLALTQIAIETLGAVVFVLVLRRMPKRFGSRITGRAGAIRLAVSVLVGLFVFAFLVVAGSSRTEAPISTEFVERSLADGGGRNVVNVVLVDIRGFDTMGEITVLAVAAMGVYGLARLSRQESSDGRSFAPTRRRRTPGGGA